MVSNFNIGAVNTLKKFCFLVCTLLLIKSGWSQSSLYGWEKQFSSNDFIIQLKEDTDQLETDLFDYLKTHQTDTLYFNYQSDSLTIRKRPFESFLEQRLPTGDLVQKSVYRTDTTVRFYDSKGFCFYREIRKKDGYIDCVDHYANKTKQSSYTKRDNYIRFDFSDEFGVKQQTVEFENGIWTFSEWPIYGNVKVEERFLIKEGDTIGMHQIAQDGRFQYRINCKDSTSEFRQVNNRTKTDIWERKLPGKYFFSKRVAEDSITIVQQNPPIYLERFTTTFGFEEKYFENGKLISIQRQQNPKPGNQYHRLADTLLYPNRGLDTIGLMIQKFHPNNGNVLMEEQYFQFQFSPNERLKINYENLGKPLKQVKYKRNKNFNEYKKVTVFKGKKNVEKSAKRLEFFDALKARRNRKSYPVYSRPYIPTFGSGGLRKFSSVEVNFEGKRLTPFPKFITFENDTLQKDLFEVVGTLTQYSKKEDEAIKVIFLFEEDTTRIIYDRKQVSIEELKEKLFENPNNGFFNNPVIEALDFLEYSKVSIGKNQYLISQPKDGKSKVTYLGANPKRVEVIWDLRESDN